VRRSAVEVAEFEEAYPTMLVAARQGASKVGDQHVEDEAVAETMTRALER